jgi:hypothetical protein
MDFLPNVTSSISNSKRIPSAFLVTLAILCTFRAIDFFLPPSQYEHFDNTPIDSDYYLAYSGGSIEHGVFFYGDEGVLKPLKAADVLFLGNSRLMCAFPRRHLQPFFEQRGLKYYMMGFCLGEHVLFPQALFRKFDLHPKLVVINTAYFFMPELSPAADEVMRTSYFDALKVRWEVQLGSLTTHVIGSRTLARLLDWQDSFLWEVFRSKSDGTWLVKYLKARPKPVNSLPTVSRVFSQKELDTAKAFKEMLDRRGTKMILTDIPTRLDDREQARTMSKYLNVPLILVSPEGLNTVDSSHLDQKSIDFFNASFFEKLSKYLDANPISAAEKYKSENAR